MTEAVIAGAIEVAYARRPDPATTTETLLAEAVARALAETGLERREVDGLAVASFTLPPDHAIDLAWKLGLRPRFLMDDANGGASGLNMLQHALRAVEAGDADVAAVLSMRENALTIPNEAVFVEGDQAFVFVVKPDSTVARTALTLGTRRDTDVEVLGGLEPSARVVRAGHQKLFDGAKVLPIQSQGTPGAAPSAPGASSAPGSSSAEQS